MVVVSASDFTQSTEWFYAIHNQFQANGPKGVTEFKMLENEDMFVRMDLPGVPEDGVRVTLDQSNKAVFVCAVAPKVHRHDSSPRSYITSTGLVCRCCKIASFTSQMSHGVLRLLLSKTPISPQRSSPISYLAGPGFREDLRGTGPHTFPYGSNPDDPALTGPVLVRHPCVLHGSAMAYESKQLDDGSLYVRLDMPGVSKENFSVSVTNGKVNVTGQAPAVGNDSAGRFYIGDVAMLSPPVDLPSRRVKTIIKNGVIRLIVPPA